MRKTLTAATLTLGLTLTATGATLATPALAAPNENANAHAFTQGNGNGKGRQTAPGQTQGARSTTPDIAALAGPLADQEMEWTACDFGDADLDALFPGAECATMEVPRDWHHPDDGNTFEIAISRVVTVDPDSPDYRGTIVTNPGGPGGPGQIWGPGLWLYTPQLHGTHNYLGFDPRGVGASTHAECVIPAEDAAGVASEFDLFALMGDCQEDPDVRAITTEQTVYDMDLLRHVAGVEQLSYVGYSYGTWLGAWYGALFPDNAGEFLLDSSTGITDPTLERTFEIQSYGRDRQFEEHVMNWIARHDDTYGLSTVPSDVYASYLHGQEVLGDDVTMLVWLLTGGYTGLQVNSFYPLTATTVQAVVEIAAMVESGELDLDAEMPEPELVRSLTAVLGDRVAEDSPVLEEPPVPEDLVVDDPFYWITCQDGQFDRDVESQLEQARRSGEDNPVSRALGVNTAFLPCSYFETDLAKPAPGQDFPSTVLVQTELDAQTAWELGSEAGGTWPNTTFLAIDNEGSHAVFPYGLSTVDEPVLDLFRTGVRPPKDLVVQAKPLPGDTTTWESWQRLNPRAKHVGPNRDDAWQPIKTQGNGHPTLPPEGLPFQELIVATTGDPAVEASYRLQRLVDAAR